MLIGKLVLFRWQVVDGKSVDYEEIIEIDEEFAKRLKFWMDCYDKAVGKYKDMLMKNDRSVSVGVAKQRANTIVNQIKKDFKKQ